MLNFKNIYIEKNALNYQITKSILAQNSDNASIILIDHYKDVFCRSKQDISLQKNYQDLILAERQNDFIYKGASVCQDFDNENFYYSSCVMNCVCNCEYCYLKGMYPSGHLVVFVNIEDYFRYLDDKEIYLCVSYDTDLFPLEDTLGYVKKWCDFASTHPKIKLEVRTKFKNLKVWNYPAPSNISFAFSLSPNKIIKNFEHKTSSLDARLDNIKAAQDKGFITRLCFDPIIYCKDWKKVYKELIDKTVSTLDMDKITDISIGSFRISQSYLKKMRKFDNSSAIVNFPFTNVDGYYQYEPKLQSEMEDFVKEEICKHFPDNKVFLWK